MSNLIILFPLTILGAMIQAAMGFGQAVLMMNFYPLFFPYTKAVALCQVIVVIFNFVFMGRYFKKIKWKIIMPMIVPAFVISVIFTFISVSMNFRLMNLFLGMFFLMTAIFYLCFSEKIKVKPTKTNGIIMGSFSALLNAFFSIAGPPAALYLAPIIDDGYDYNASIQTFFTFTSIGCLIARLVSGVIETVDIPFIVLGWICTITGMFLGLKISDKFRFDTIKKAIYIFVGLNGLWIVIKYFFPL